MAQQPPGQPPRRLARAPNSSSGNGGRTPGHSQSAFNNSSNNGATNRPPGKPTKPPKAPTMVGQAAKFVFTPEIGRSLESVKFAWHLLVNLVAQVYVGVGLIDKNHPCTDLRYAKNYKLFDIIQIAYKSLKWQRDQIPQIVIFFAVLAFLFFIALSLITLILNVSVNAAHAQSPGTSGNAANDVLNQIFNLNGTGLIPTAFGAMLRAYSNIILVLAGLILIWTIIHYVVESARQGQAGGKSFNHTWAPVRLVFALGLLVPLTSGLNSGQYITLYLAKWGSDMASKVYTQFNDQLGLGQAITQNNGGVNTQQKLAQLFDVLTCTYKYNIDNPSDPISLPPATVQDANNPNIVNMRFVPASGNGTSLGNKNGCGVIPFYSNPNPSTSAEKLLNQQFTFLSQNLTGENGLSNLAQDYVSHVKDNGAGNSNYFKALDLPQYRQKLSNMAQNYSNALGVAYQDAISSENSTLTTEIENSIQGLGWVTAPMWYYRVAQANAAINQAYTALPEVKASSSTDSDLILNDDNAKPNDSTGFWNLFVSKLSEFFDFSNLIGPSVYKSVIVDATNPLSSLISFGNGVFYAAQVAFAGWGATALMLGLSATEIQVLGNGVQIQAGPALIDAMTPLITAFIGMMFMNGMMLSIILPMMPIVRFSFGVLGWLVIVFVGVMGMPLFALAHLKTGGEGWIGQLQVASAYNMLIGIIIRPTLIVIGLISSLIVFNSVAKLFGIILIGGMQDVMHGNDSFQVLHGLNFTEQVLKLFFFSATITALANTCFKLIDIVPTQAMVWMGTGPSSSFTDGAEQEVSQQTQSFGSTYNQAYGSRLGYNARKNYLEGQALRGGDNRLEAETTPGKEPGQDSAGGASDVSIEQGGAGANSANALQITSGEPGGGGDQPSNGNQSSPSGSGPSTGNAQQLLSGGGTGGSNSGSGRSGGNDQLQLRPGESWSSGRNGSPIILPTSVSPASRAAVSSAGEQPSSSPAQSQSSSGSSGALASNQSSSTTQSQASSNADAAAPSQGSDAPLPSQSSSSTAQSPSSATPSADTGGTQNEDTDATSTPSTAAPSSGSSGQQQAAGAGPAGGTGGKTSGSRDGAVDDTTAPKPLLDRLKENAQNVAKNLVRPNSAARQYGLAFGGAALLGATGLGPVASMLLKSRLNKEFAQSNKPGGGKTPMMNFLGGEKETQTETLSNVGKSGTSRQENNTEEKPTNRAKNTSDWNQAGGRGGTNQSNNNPLAADPNNPLDPKRKFDPTSPYYNS